MSCNICGQATGPGALLCRPCKAALKRARQYTMLELPGTRPAVTVGGLPADPPRRTVRARRAARARPAPRAWPRVALAGMAAIAMLAALAYAGRW